MGNAVLSRVCTSVKQHLNRDLSGVKERAMWISREKCSDDRKGKGKGPEAAACQQKGECGWRKLAKGQEIKPEGCAWP